MELSLSQYSLVYNMLSFGVATMFAAFVFFIGSRSDVGAKYRPALLVTSLVVFIAGYHYWRILGSWEAAFTLVSGTYKPSGHPFNDAYRYVDWLLTVPLLLVELVAVMNLPKSKTGTLMPRLILAAVLMIALGYPGEVAGDMSTRGLWGIFSTIPFLYILLSCGASWGNKSNPNLHK